MTARSHHYVPQWLQRRFLCNESRYYYLDLSPERRQSAPGVTYTRQALHRWGPKRCFAQRDLYATGYTDDQIDVVEREFFGEIDDRASQSLEYISSGEYAPSNTHYEWFLRYLSVQKMRTPKGLDWLSSFGSYAFGPINSADELMGLLQHIGEMHVTTWAESVWEVVTAPMPDVGFILTDHPVTAYNLKAYPGSRFCRHPTEPVIELLGTRTLFPLDVHHCLILSNQEFVEKPRPSRCLKERTNPRAFGATFFSPEHIVRGRVLMPMEALAVNFILKKRAFRYIAASQRAWLWPERSLSDAGWAKLDRVLQPKRPTLIRSIWAEFSDGSTVAMDRLGWSITDPKEIAEMEEFERQRNRRSRHDRDR